MMIACRMSMHKLIFALLENGADENAIDKGAALDAYKKALPLFDFVRKSRQESRLISKHHMLNVIDGQKVRAS